MLSKLPYLLSVLGMIGGVSIAILFGVNETLFKNRIIQQLESNPSIQNIKDPSSKAVKLKKEKIKTGDTSSVIIFTPQV